MIAEWTVRFSTFGLLRRIRVPPSSRTWTPAKPRSRPMSATAERRQRLRTMIQAVFDADHETYGYRRIHVVLTRSGEQVSPELVRQLMRQMALQPIDIEPGCVFHSDRGSNYTSEEFGRHLSRYQMRRSVGRTGSAGIMPWPSRRRVEERVAQPHGVCRTRQGPSGGRAIHRGLL
jgi:hypothetical protein